MNSDQVNAYIRTLCTLVGGTLMTSAGWSQGQVDSLTSGLLGLSGLIFLGVSVYGARKAHSVQGRVASVASLPGTTIVTEPDIAKAAPQANVVSTADNKVVTTGVSS